ncbi:MAG TPA: Hsp20/alpha crystallin family protein [Novosphingobium sp.]|nr:Hsp20/alpha crystallin family protein [Novosphingobium sp.]
MAIRDMVPWRRHDSGANAAPARLMSTGERHPIARFRQEMDRLFDDFFSFPPLSRSPADSFPMWPSLEVKENDNNIIVTAELAGLTDKDVEVSVDKGVLTIRGEKKSTSEDKDSGWSERFYGRFERSVALPDGADEEKCEASFRDGVLTVSLPVTEAKRNVRRIPIQSGR